MPPLRLRTPVFLVLASLAACEQAQPVYVPAVARASDTRPIWIGEFGSWSGPGAREGLADHRGFELAIASANAAGGVRGRPVRVHGYDDRGTIEGARAAGHRLAHDDKAVMIAGGTTCELAEAAAQSAGEVPLVSGACLHGNQKGIEGLESGSRARAEILAEHVRTLGLKRVTLLVRSGMSGDRELADAFGASLKVRSIEHDERAISAEGIDEVLAKLVIDPPPAIFVACTGSEAAVVCSVLARRRVASQVYAAGAPDLEVLPTELRAALDGVVAASGWDPDAATGLAAEFAAHWRARFTEAPGPRAFHGYALGRRVVDALTRAREYWPADVRTALDAVRSPKVELVLVRVQHGELHSIRAARNRT